ncbi:hypothetical protein GCE86_05930 [Micromonospora terminaliae]|uniref:Uncharacterized protein n=1 Tax=Micromonospora terminaliae TaxID=1914461 RepID=A0ABX6DXQ4_9ACTN|nr:hypothetical protein GCE86_05930 [Micromonospora terminaliae]
MLSTPPASGTLPAPTTFLAISANRGGWRERAPARLAAKAYGRPTAGGRGTYVSFPVPDRPELVALVDAAAGRAATLWAAHRGLG